jgi:ABC-type transporter Mla subunit MlaD
MPTDFNTELQAILADLGAARVALRQSSTAFDAAIPAMRQALDSMAAANHAQGEAMDAVIAATDKAMALFTSTERH